MKYVILLHDIADVFTVHDRTFLICYCSVVNHISLSLPYLTPLSLSLPYLSSSLSISLSPPLSLSLPYLSSSLSISLSPPLSLSLPYLSSSSPLPLSLSPLSSPLSPPPPSLPPLSLSLPPLSLPLSLLPPMYQMGCGYQLTMTLSFSVLHKSTASIILSVLLTDSTVCLPAKPTSSLVSPATLKQTPFNY